MIFSNHNSEVLDLGMESKASIEQNLDHVSMTVVILCFIQIIIFIASGISLMDLFLGWHPK